MVCGSETCYATTPQTFAVSAAVTTTDSDGSTITTVLTSSTVLTDGPSPTDSLSATVAGVPKLIPSTVSKLPSIETGSGSSSGSSGLSSSQLGGIVGGAVAFLLIILSIAALVIWRLRRTEKAVQAAGAARKRGERDNNSSSSSGAPKSGSRPAISEVDGSTDVDSVALARARYHHARSDDAASTAAGSELDASDRGPLHFYGSNASTTPPTWGLGSSGGGGGGGGGGYFVPLHRSDASDGRQSSLDSYARNYNTSPPLRPGSSESQRSRRTHARQWSDASELDGSSVVSGSAHHGVPASELESLETSEAAQRRRRSSSFPRRASDPPGRGDSGGGGVGGGDGKGGGGGALGTLNEVNELHGYYGAPNMAVGQTLSWKNGSSSSLPRT